MRRESVNQVGLRLLAVLSGREETVALLDQIRAEVGDDPKD